MAQLIFEGQAVKHKKILILKKLLVHALRTLMFQYDTDFAALNIYICCIHCIVYWSYLSAQGTYHNITQVDFIVIISSIYQYMVYLDIIIIITCISLPL